MREWWRGVRQRKDGAIRGPAGRVSRRSSEPTVIRHNRKRKSRENTCPARFFSSRGVPAPSTMRRIRLKLKAPTWTNCRFRMFSRPRRWAAPHATRLVAVKQINDSLPEVHLAMGGLYLATGRFAEAVEEMKRAVELAPNSDEAYRRLATANLRLGKKNEAMEAYQKALQIGPYYWANYNAIGNAYYELGDYDRALTAFQRIVELAPEISIGYENVGGVYFSQGKFKEAIQYWEKALAITPNPDLYSNIGTSYFYLQRYAESVPMFEKAVAMNPNDEETTGNLADAYRWNGQKEKSFATYDKAIALAYKELQANSKKASTMGDLAGYYAKKGDRAQSIEWISRARSIDPNAAVFAGIDLAAGAEKTTIHCTMRRERGCHRG
jgi:tetratricopeptide (TPR) repeat protein